MGERYFLYRLIYKRIFKVRMLCTIKLLHCYLIFTFSFSALSSKIFIFEPNRTNGISFKNESLARIEANRSLLPLPTMVNWTRKSIAIGASIRVLKIYRHSVVPFSMDV